MRDAVSQLLSGGWIVMPKIVRQKLGLRTGDLIRFKLRGNDIVTIGEARSTGGDLFTAFNEWASDEDEKLYGEL